MSVEFELQAEPRPDVGKGASRRLRRQGLLPAILYGGGQQPEALSLQHNEVVQQLANEAFYSHILNVNIGARTEQAILRDLQRHPYKPAILHLDLQRVSVHEKLRVHVPLHFMNEDICRGVKQQSGSISHHRIEVEVSCLPKDIPEFIEVDLTEVGIGEAIHLSELSLAAGVEIVELGYGPEYDVPVVSVHGLKPAAEEGMAEAGEAAAE